jgi:hypothetical protein
VTSTRHVPWHVIEQRLAKATPIRDSIPGDPRVTIDVERDGALALCVFVPREADENLPPFVNLACERRGTASHSHVRFACGITAYLPEFYNVIRRTADRVQVDHMRVDDAIRAAAGEVEEMLQTAELLDFEQQLGLWGELRMLSFIAGKRSWSEALDSWAHVRGSNEEHDFVLADVDIEVKTTRTEQRVHAVGPTQLIPSPGRRLLVCSVQLTLSGVDDGESLTTLINRIRRDVPRREKAKFEKGLSHAGWIEKRAANYTLDRWRLRSIPIVVSANLLPTLERKGPARERIVGFKFHLSLAGLENQQEEEWKWE